MTIVTTRNSYLGFSRSDDTVQTIRLPEIIASKTETEIRNVMKYLTDNQILLDSKDGSVLPSSSIFTAYTTAKTTKTLDLE